MAKSSWGNTVPILTEDSFQEYFDQEILDSHK